jgi:hypothetical protein
MAVSGDADRRGSTRRVEDRKLDLVLKRQANAKVRRAAVGLLAVAAILLGIATVALALGHANDQHALDRATRAAQSSESAVRSSESALASARAAVSQAVQARQLGRAIEQSRVQSCRSANARHSHTLVVLGRLLKPVIKHATPKAKGRLRAQKKATLALLNAIVPHYNCRSLKPAP